MRKEDAWERFCWEAGLSGRCGEGLAGGERGSLVLPSLETAGIVVIVRLCAGDSLLFTRTDAVRSGYIVVRQKHHPLPAGWCQVIVVHPLPLWFSGKHPAALQSGSQSLFV